MRLIFGIILGIALTVGGAYISDTATKSPSSAVDVRPMVNWDVVAKNFDYLTGLVKDGWAKLTNKG
jgi:hypothetical protein